MKQNQTWNFHLNMTRNVFLVRISIVTRSNQGGGGRGVGLNVWRSCVTVQAKKNFRKTYHFSVAHEIDHHDSFLVISQPVYSLPQLFDYKFCWFVTSL